MENPELMKELEQCRAALKDERTSFIAHWRDLSAFVRPRRSRFLTTDRNRGDRRNDSIINGVATQSLGIARSGMMAGVMSPARPWFTLGTPDPDMMEYRPVKEWLEKVEHIIRTIFNDSNFYRTAPSLLNDLLLYGTAAMTHVDDFDDVARFFSHGIGSFCIAQDAKHRVNTLFRELSMTVKQVVDEFGIENVSRSVKDSYDRGNYHVWVEVGHLIEPNPNYKIGNPLSKYKKFRAVYWELGGQGSRNSSVPTSASASAGNILQVKGFTAFPGYCPRWDTLDEDIYATDCPGMVALGDVISLQHQERRKAQALDKIVSPPMKGPAALRNVPVSSMPGGLTVYDQTGTGEGLSPVYQIQTNLQEWRLDMAGVEQRIKEAFFVDLFKAITDMEGIQPRNEFDLVQRNEERLLQLGPILENIHGEFLSPLIDRTFAQCVKADILPEAPKELQGMPLKVTYISTLAMAQRAVALSGIDRLAGFIAGLVKSGYTDAGDKFDADQSVDEYAKALGTPARLVVSDDDVAKRREQRQKAQQMQQAMMSAQAGAETVKTLADAKTSEPSMLTTISDTLKQRAGR